MAMTMAMTQSCVSTQMDLSIGGFEEGNVRPATENEFQQAGPVESTPRAERDTSTPTLVPALIKPQLDDEQSSIQQTIPSPGPKTPIKHSDDDENEVAVTRQQDEEDEEDGVIGIRDDEEDERIQQDDTRQIEADFELALRIHAMLMAEQEEERRAIPPPTRDCGACGEATPIADLPALLNCTHEPRTCADCYAKWITAAIERNGFGRILCPEPDCTQELEYADMQHYSTESTFQKYDTLLTRTYLNSSPNYRWCLNATCTSGQIHEDSSSSSPSPSSSSSAVTTAATAATDEDIFPIFICNACGTKACVKHDILWHEGETCGEYDERLEVSAAQKGKGKGREDREEEGREEQEEEDREEEQEDKDEEYELAKQEQEKASKEAVETLSKVCPGKNCLWRIEKLDGCDHMTCSRCRHEFCWVCLADYKDIRKLGNLAHASQCRYYM